VIGSIEESICRRSIWRWRGIAGVRSQAPEPEPLSGAGPEIRRVRRANAGKTLYSADVARQLGVSVRTLHNAVVAVRGMSMHRYMRLRRLWSVRQQLVRGVSLQSIKAVALVNGFWHMGEFTAVPRPVWRNAAAHIGGSPRSVGQFAVMSAKRR
jgi:AraC-like DNA-binding protein